MSNFDNTNRGQIWRAEKQKETDRDFQGSINIEGVEYWLSGWSRKPTDNPKSPSVRFSVQAKEQTHNEGYQQAQQVMQNQQQSAPAHAPPQQRQQAPQQQQRQQPQQQQQAPMSYEDEMQMGNDFNDDIPF